SAVAARKRCGRRRSRGRAKRRPARGRRRPRGRWRLRAGSRRPADRARRARRTTRVRARRPAGRGAGADDTTELMHGLLIAASTSDTATGVGIPLAVAAGLVSFLSPCVLPLVPGYLSTVIGVTPADLRGGVGARRVLVPSLLFIASFSAIFILLGLGATVIGSTLKHQKTTLEHIGGAIIIAMGVAFLA